MTVMTIISILKTLILVSLFFVWVVRYSNIVSEFKEYGLPDWFRDVMGIVKLTFGLMIFQGASTLVVLGAMGLAVLMTAAVFMHIKVKHAFFQMIPSLSLLGASVFIVLQVAT